MTNHSLSHRLWKANAALIVAVVVLGATAITSFVALRIDAGRAIEEYREMLMLKHAEEGLQRAMLELRLATIDPAGLSTELTRAKQELVDFIKAHEDEEDEGYAVATRETWISNRSRFYLHLSRTIGGVTET